MYLAYSLVFSFGLIIATPYFLYQALAHGKYIRGLRQRFGFVPRLDGNPVIWLHCVSVGETQAARPLVKRLRQDFPDYALVVSTITDTGQTLAHDVFRNEAISICYFPLDLRSSVRRALDQINPAAVLIMETEIWPNFLRECAAREIPVALVNGRISPGSYRWYSLINRFLHRVLPFFSIAVMQTEEDADRLRALGMPAEKLFTAGNLKFDAQVASGLSTKTEEIRNRFGLDSELPLIVAASTHQPEEEIVLNSIKQVRNQHPVRLMLVPRHPQRFNEVAALIEKSGMSWTRKTDRSDPKDITADVILLDTIGELPATFTLAQIVFVGGSIVKKGGQNVVEPAAARATIVTGPHTDNFHAIVRQMKEAQAIVQLPALDNDAASAKLAEVFSELLSNSNERVELARRAKQLVIENQGATDKTLKLVAPLLSRASRASSKPNTAQAANAHTS